MVNGRMADLRAWVDYDKGSDRQSLACGRCLGCLIDYSKDYGARAQHEHQTHGYVSCFMTLTYSPERIGSPSLEPEDLTKFLRKLRKAIGPFRFMACGEYGGKTGRKHFHVVVFGHDFAAERTLHSVSLKGHKQYISPTVLSAWSQKRPGDPVAIPNGHATVAAFHQKGAEYVARYVTKKSKMPFSLVKPGEWVHHHTGEVVSDPVRPFFRVSKHPGLGHDWFMQYYREVFPHDYFVIDGRRFKPPRYYDRLLERVDPEMYAKVKERRIEGVSEADKSERRNKARLAFLENATSARSRGL